MAAERRTCRFFSSGGETNRETHSSLKSDGGCNLCLVSSITFAFIYNRFRNRFRNPCPHCRFVAPLPLPYRVPNGYGKMKPDPIWTDERKRLTYGNGERYCYT